MELEYIKEKLHNLRLSRNLLWNTLIILTGGFIGLTLKITVTKTPILEIIYLVLGFLGIISFSYLMNCVSNEIDIFNKELKNRGDKQ